MSSSHRLTREQKGKKAAFARGSSEDPEDIHHEAMMDTGNMDLAQRLLVSEAREQFRDDDDGQEAVDVSTVPISYYPGNIFAEESPLEACWISDTLPHINQSTSKRLSLFTRAEQKEINRAKTMKQLLDLSLIVAGKIGAKKGASGSKVGPSEPEPTDATPVSAEQALAGGSSQRKDSRKKKKNPEARRESNEEENVEQTDAGGSSKKGNRKRKAGDPPADDVPKKKKMKKKDFSLPRPSSVCEEELQTLVRGNNSGMTTMVKRRSMSRLFRSVTIQEIFSPRRAHWRPVGHPNLATYPEDWKESARIVAWISDTLPHINQSTSKRLSLFTRAEQKEINRAKSLKQFPDLSLIMAGKIGAKKGASGSKVGPSEPEPTDATPVSAEQALAGGSSQRKDSRKKKKNAEARRESNEEENVEQTDAGGSSKKGNRKRKAGDPPADDVPKKKKMKKKDFSLPRPSSVCEEELQTLVPETVPEVGTSDDDEDETVAFHLRRREKRTIDERSHGAFAGDQGISETPRKSSVSEGRRDRLLDESPARIAEGSETRVSVRPKETPEDGFKFEFNHDLPLAFHLEDCGRLLQLIKGGPDQLPPVKDLVFKDEYEHAASSSIKSQGDWNVLVEKYDMALKRAKEQIHEGEEVRKKAEEALRVAVRDKNDAIAREKALRKLFDETRTADAARAVESLKYAEEMSILRKSRKYEVTHERIRVLIAMIAKAKKRFHKISLREDQRDKYDDARCLHSQAFGTRKCLEQIKASGLKIPQETNDFFAGQEKHYEEEAACLEVKEIPAENLRLSPLVLESQFLIEDIWRQIDPFGSNVDLIDSEAAIALRTLLVDRDPRSEDMMKEPTQTAVSSNQRTDQDIDPAKQASAGAVVPKDGAVPTIVLTDSPAKASKNASSSTSSSEDPEKEDGVPAGCPREVPTANADLPAPTKFGRVSGPGEGDDGGIKDPPVVDEYNLLSVVTFSFSSL
uniref:Uncharacterized protein n=1 Tax=Brassica campestris TaxID=3711 RepID=M4DXR4_BRACM